MTRRAADAAVNGGDVPALLRRAWRIQQWPGAPVDSMRAREFAWMQFLARVFDTVRRFRSAKDIAAASRADPDGWRLMAWLRSIDG